MLMFVFCMLVFLVVLQTGPKDLSSKRARTNVGSSSQQSPPAFNRETFIGGEQEVRYVELAAINIWT